MTTAARTYLGPDNARRSLDAHLAYLEECAKRWDEEAAPGFGRSAKHREAAKEQAARVRATIARLRQEN
jgi:hypothetical protein